jgi:hypothetical protein
MPGSDPGGGGSIPSPEAKLFEPVVQRNENGRLRSGRPQVRILPGSLSHADVAQWQEALVLGTRSWGFESLRRHPFILCRGGETGRRTGLRCLRAKALLRVRLPPSAFTESAGVAQTGRRAVLKKRSLRVRVPPPASRAWPNRQRRQAQTLQVESSNLSARTLFKGMYANGQRGLTFNQAPRRALRVRVPPSLCSSSEQ